MNKEKLAAQLVCLLDVASLPEDTADLKQEIESFFISGSARIDLIAKVMDFDDDIGQYQFDIALFEKTEKAIADIGESTGMKVIYSSELASPFICMSFFLSIFVNFALTLEWSSFLLNNNKN